MYLLNSFKPYTCSPTNIVSIALLQPKIDGMLSNLCNSYKPSTYSPGGVGEVRRGGPAAAQAPARGAAAAARARDHPLQEGTSQYVHAVGGLYMVCVQAA